VSTKGLCRLTNTALELVLDLGRQPLGNGFLTPDGFADEYFYDLQCGFAEDSKLFQLIEQPAPELMFHEDYAFISGTSEYMKRHFEEFAASVLERGFCPAVTGFAVELGCNDGILLGHFADRDIRHLGVEPSSDVAAMAAERGINVITEFFGAELADRIVAEHGHADIVMAANVMCHIPDITDLASGIAALLSPTGVLVFEDPYLGAVIELTSYDQIYDEHVFLFSALSVQNIFATVGMELIDTEVQATHGGSMRYTLGKIGQHQASPRVAQTLAKETDHGLGRVETFHAFAERVAANGQALKELLAGEVAAGHDVAAFGATSKSTTIYNYAGIGPDLISCIFDNTPLKIGKLSPGVHIPIIESDAFASQSPEVAFLAAWNHEGEILARNQAFSAGGGRWISHVPTVRFL